MKRRNTNQRDIVYDVINEFGHITIEKLIDYIKINYSNISLATIYRNINFLIDDNKIKKIKLKDEDVLETIKHNHYHFVCEKCHEIYDIDESLVANLVDELKKIEEHEVERCDISLYGVCSKCKERLD